ncbi:transporter, partial [Exiguobacterium mexicanum]
VPLLGSEAIVCSRLKRGDMLVVPQPTTEIHLGDLLHVVGQKEDLNKVRLILGEEVDASLSTSNSTLHSVRVVVTNDAVLSKRLKELNLKQKYDVVVTRLNRTGIDLVANNNSVLQFGDILNIVGRPESIEAVTALLGNAKQKLQQVQMLPVFLGIGLGVVLGSIPVFVPGFPAALKLGLAGGPLVVALILGRIGTIGRLYWFMPPSANLALRELGIVMFLA